MQVTVQTEDGEQTIKGVERIDRSINGFMLLTDVPDTDDIGEFVLDMDGRYVHQDDLLRVE